MAKIARVELTSEEIDHLLTLARGRYVELERALTRLGEAEGMDATMWQVARNVRPQVEMFQDLMAKLEAARHEILGQKK